MDTAELRRIADELRACAASWESHARVLGNVRADDVVRLCAAFDSLVNDCATARAERDDARRQRDDAYACVRDLAPQCVYLCTACAIWGLLDSASNVRPAACDRHRLEHHTVALPHADVIRRAEAGRR